MNEKKWEEILQDIDDLERQYFPETWLSDGGEILKNKQEGQTVEIKKRFIDEKEKELREKERNLFEEQKNFLEKRLKDKNNDYESVKVELIQANQFLSKEIERYQKEIEVLRSYLLNERKLNQEIINNKMVEIGGISKEFKEVIQYIKNIPKLMEEIKKTTPVISPDEINKIKETERINARAELTKLKETYEKKIEELKSQIEEKALTVAPSAVNLEKSKLMFYDDVTRGFVHRIKNFLGIIEGSAQYILANLKLDDELKDQINSIDEGAKELEKSVNEFSTIGRIPDFAPALKNISILIKNIIAELNSKIKEKKIELLLEIPDEINLLFDEKLTYDIFKNIIINSIEAIKETGKISIQYETNTNEKKCIFKIGDNGVGISESHIGKIFQPFFTNKKNWKGLGLTIAKRNMLMHNGDIIIESQKGKGTVVKIIFNN